MSTPICLFSTVPAEVRVIIYHFALYDTWCGRIPPLIAALRCSPSFYYEALQVFVETNIYILSSRSRVVDHPFNRHVRNDLHPDSMSDFELYGVPALWLRTVKGLHVVVPNKADCHSHQCVHTTAEWFRVYNFAGLTLPYFTNVRQLQFSLGGEDDCSRPDYMKFFRFVTWASGMLRSLGNLEQLFIGLDYKHIVQHGLYLEYCLRHVDLTLGTPGRVMRVLTGDSLIWEWNLGSMDTTRAEETRRLEGEDIFSQAMRMPEDMLPTDEATCSLLSRLTSRDAVLFYDDDALGAYSTHDRRNCGYRTCHFLHVSKLELASYPYLHGASAGRGMHPQEWVWRDEYIVKSLG